MRDRKGEDTRPWFPGVADAWLTVTQFAAAGLFLVLAAVLLAVKFNSRLNRAFAIFLLLRGTTFLLQIAARLPSNADIAQTLFDVARYFVLATPFVLLYFVVLYLSPRGGLRVRVAGIAALLLVLIFEGLYLVDHCLAACPEGGNVPGPLTPLVQGIPFAEGIAGLALAWAGRKHSDGIATRAVVLVACAFTLLALAEAIQVLPIIFQDGWEAFDGWLGPARMFGLGAIAASLLSIVVLLKILPHWRGRILLLAAAVIVSATTLYQLYSEIHSDTQALSITNALFGLWRLLASALVAYALVRHRFLDLDLRINWTISRGSVFAILAGTFIVVFQVVENALDQRLGIVVGGLATGVMLLAIRPLERLGDRIAASLHPRGRLDKLDGNQREALFREQAMMVWADGVIGRKERLLLDNLRERLGIDVAVAARIEHSAAMDSGTSPAPRGLSSQS